MIVGSSAIGELPGIGDSYAVNKIAYDLDLLMRKDISLDVPYGLLVSKDCMTDYGIGAAFSKSQELGYTAGTSLSKPMRLDLPMDMLVKHTSTRSYSTDLLIRETKSQILNMGMTSKATLFASYSLDQLIQKDQAICMEYRSMIQRFCNLELPCSCQIQKGLSIDSSFDVLVAHRNRMPYSASCGVFKADIRKNLAISIKVVDSPTIHRPKKHLVYTIATHERS